MEHGVGALTGSAHLEALREQLASTRNLKSQAQDVAAKSQLRVEAMTVVFSLWPLLIEF